jgi:hypothetical protein
MQLDLGAEEFIAEAVGAYSPILKLDVVVDLRGNGRRHRALSLSMTVKLEI